MIQLNLVTVEKRNPSAGLVKYISSQKHLGSVRTTLLMQERDSHATRRERACSHLSLKKFKLAYCL